jgi:hypothetical protein
MDPENAQSLLYSNIQMGKSMAISLFSSIVQQRGNQFVCESNENQMLNNEQKNGSLKNKMLC